MVGAIKSAAHLIYNTPVDVTIHEISRHFVNQSKSRFHACLKIHLPEDLRTTDPITPVLYHPNQNDATLFHPSETSQNCPFSGFTSDNPTVNGSNVVPSHNYAGTHVTGEHLSVILPFHIMFDFDMLVAGIGSTLQKLCTSIKPGKRLTEGVQLIYPKIPFEFKSIVDFLQSSFTMEISRSNNQENICLKGIVVLSFFYLHFFRIELQNEDFF